MVTSSRPTEVVDRCSDCRPFACERPVTTGSFSCEPARSDSHRSLKGRSRLEPWPSPRCGVFSGCRRRSWSPGTGRVGPAWWTRDGLEPQHNLAEGEAHEPPCRDPERVADQDPGTTRTQAWMPAGPTTFGAWAAASRRLWPSRRLETRLSPTTTNVAESVVLVPTGTFLSRLTPVGFLPSHLEHVIRHDVPVQSVCCTADEAGPPEFLGP